MNVGFHLCINDWCFQKGTNQQYTKCKKASEDGRTCYNPTIRDGSMDGMDQYVGRPFNYWNNRIHDWCRQLFPTSIKGNATYNSPQTFVTTAVYWMDGKWKDSPTKNVYHNYLMDTVTCQIP